MDEVKRAHSPRNEERPTKTPCFPTRAAEQGQGTEQGAGTRNGAGGQEAAGSGAGYFWRQSLGVSRPPAAVWTLAHAPRVPLLASRKPSPAFALSSPCQPASPNPSPRYRSLCRFGTRKLRWKDGSELSGGLVGWWREGGGCWERVGLRVRVSGRGRFQRPWSRWVGR